MLKALSFVLLCAGVALMAYGIGAEESLCSDISRLFTGETTGKGIWFLIGGGAVAVAGLSGLMGEAKPDRPGQDFVFFHRSHSRPR